MTHTKYLAAVGSLAFAMGCNRAPEAEHERALQAQAEATQAAAKAQREADQKAAEAQKKANEEMVRAQTEANREGSEAQENANATIRSANENVLKQRDELRAWAVKKINEIENRVDESKTKAQKASGDAKQKFERSLETVDKKREEVKDELGMLDAQAAQGLTAFRTRLEKGLAELGTAVQRLEATL